MLNVFPTATVREYLQMLVFKMHRLETKLCPIVFSKTRCTVVATVAQRAVMWLRGRDMHWQQSSTSALWPLLSDC